MRHNNHLSMLHAVITLIVPRGAAAAAAAACSPVNRVNITYLYLYFPLLIIMSCQLTLFLAFLLHCTSCTGAETKKVWSLAF